MYSSLVLTIGVETTEDKTCAQARPNHMLKAYGGCLFCIIGYRLTPLSVRQTTACRRQPTDCYEWLANGSAGTLNQWSFGKTAVILVPASG